MFILLCEWSSDLGYYKHGRLPYPLHIHRPSCSTAPLFPSFLCSKPLILTHDFCLLLQGISLYAYLLFNLLLTSFPLSLYFYLSDYRGCQMMDWTHVVAYLPYVPGLSKCFKRVAINPKSQQNKQTGKKKKKTHTRRKLIGPQTVRFLRSPK